MEYSTMYHHLVLRLPVVVHDNSFLIHKLETWQFYFNLKCLSTISTCYSLLQCKLVNNGQGNFSFNIVIQ